MYFNVSVKATHCSGYKLLVKANSIDEAIQKISKQHPDYTPVEYCEANISALEKMQMIFNDIAVVDDLTFV